MVVVVVDAALYCVIVVVKAVVAAVLDDFVYVVVPMVMAVNADDGDENEKVALICAKRQQERKIAKKIRRAPAGPSNDCTIQAMYCSCYTIA